MDFIQNIENNIILFLYNFMSNNPALKEFFSIITHLGDGGFIWISIGLIFLIKKSTRKFGLIMLVSLLIGDLIGNSFLKNLIGRNRPFVQLNLVPLINPPFGYSFPSGHSLSSFVGATVVFNWNKKIGTFAYILALLIAVSRPLLSVHYISDIFSGAVLGILISCVSCKFLKNKLNF